MHHDPDRSWITDTDPDHLKGMHPKFEKRVKYANEMTSYTQPNIMSGIQSYLGQFAVQTIETWQANTCSYTENTPMAIKSYVSMATHSKYKA